MFTIKKCWKKEKREREGEKEKKCNEYFARARRGVIWEYRKQI